MVQGIVALLVVIVVISLLPVAMLAALFGIVDYLADDEKLEEIRRARHGGGSPDVSEGTATSGRQGSVDENGEYGIDPSELPAVGAEDGPDTVTCPSCGADNSREYDFCQECVREL